MKSADLLVHPAREEAAGNIIIEAMVSGLPSLVSKEVGFSDEVKKFKAGVVLNDSFSQDEFNQLLEEIIEDENLSSIKSNITSLKNDDYFFSRSRFIADFIEERF
jgi:UDP-glucose:(heptosyl)LPS alpha-1,3-glucosyltransferase